MSAALGQLWSARTARQRALLITTLLLLAGVLYLGLVRVAERERSRLQERVHLLQVHATRLEQHADEFEHLHSLPIVAGAQGDLQALVQARLAELGLQAPEARALAIGQDRVTVELNAVAFAQWLQWLDGLAAQRVRLDRCEIEALAAPGMVSVNASLVRTAPP